MKTVRFNVQLYKKFSFEELDETEQNEADGNNGTQTALVFDKGQIPHPTDKNWTVNLKGFFLLCLPHGNYPEIPEYEMERFDNMLQDWLMENHLLHSNSESILNSYSTKAIFYIAPALTSWNKKTDIVMKSLYWWKIVDNFFATSVVASTGMTPLLVKEHFTDFSKFITNVMTGLYRNSDGIPNFDIPFLNNAMLAFYKFYVDIKENVAGYDKNYQYLLNQLLNWVQSYKIRALYMGSTWEKLQQATYMFKKVCGKRIIVELIQLLTAAYVDGNIRDNLLFNIFCNSGDLIQTMVNDVFGLQRDILNEGNSSNMIVRNIKKKGMGFDQALELHMTSVNNEMIEFRQHADALAAEFPGCDQLQRYIYNYQCYVDGMIRMFPTEIRYGNCEYKIMKVITENKIL